MELKGIEVSEIHFNEKLFQSNRSRIFLVEVRNQTCIMKVHQGRGPREYYEPEGIEPNFHVREVNAYQRLQAHGLDKRGIIPHFYGSIFALDPDLCRPHLDHYLGDEYLPNAIFLEYIPGMESLSQENYTEKRMDALIAGFKDIQKALVDHGDAQLRNMKVFKDDPERAMWIDFDNALTYNEDEITERDKKYMKMEEEILENLKKKMPEDIRDGTRDRTWYWYE